MTRSRLKMCTLICALLFCSSLVAEGSPWLPVPQTISLSVSRVVQEADQFYRGDTHANLPFGEFNQTTLWFSGKYGLNDKTAIDVQLGTSEVEAGPLGSSDGTQDATVGITRSLLDELETGKFSVSMRLAGTLAGDYDTGQPHSVGDGANSITGSINVGKFLTPNFGVAGEFGLRFSTNDVPSEWFLSAGTNYIVSPYVSAYAQYQLKQSNGDLDIGGTGFTPVGFPEVQENYSRFRTGINLQYQNFSWDVNVHRTLNGRNTADFDIVSMTFTLFVDLFRP
ncbi:MAG: hypothetical protein F4227_04335 [Gammaproteobacteria bacterium]|nr:hypothetical protein [Gammaproteobacteria bacterium]MYF02201.1 hypothetical protein [Gammaproteobacteria bacterium]MYI77446.1 hypothetical protein [Gammaproteobacteria bacterium]